MEGVSRQVTAEAGRPTIVEFTLLPDYAKLLKARLKPFLGRHHPDTTLLAKAVRETLPKAMLDELAALGECQAGAASTVFVVHGLPEVEPGEIPLHVGSETLRQWLQTASYASLITRGLGEALKLVPYDTFSDAPDPLLRDRQSPGVFPGLKLHKHAERVSTLAGVWPETGQGPRTRFTDFAAVLDEARHNPDLRKLEMRTTYDDPTGGMGSIKMQRSSDASLGNLAATRHICNEPMEVNIAYRYSPMEEPEGYRAVSDLIARHSREFAVGRGSIALWSNAGCLLHQALDHAHEGAEGRFTRGALNGGFKLPGR